MAADMEPDFQPCAFCRRLSVGHFLIEGAQTVVFRDAHPLTRGHLHITPRRHHKNFFRIPENERLDAVASLWKAWEWLEINYSPAGYNIGINIGEAAGQSIPHANIHLIPRYSEEVLDRPRGSRWVLGGQGSKKSSLKTKEVLKEEPLSENRLALLLPHPRPISPGHAVILLRKKLSSFFDMGLADREAFWDLVAGSPDFIRAPKPPEGYNIAIDIGQAAGQQEDFVVAHVVPRWQGDAAEPFGVRWMAGEHSDYQSRRLGN